MPAKLSVKHIFRREVVAAAVSAVFLATIPNATVLAYGDAHDEHAASHASSTASASSHEKVRKPIVSQHGASQNVHWGYEGTAGPEYWHTLSQEYSVCNSGKRQSPIDIRGAAHAELFDLAFQYRPVALQVLNNGHTLQANYQMFSQRTVKVGGEVHPLKGKDRYESHLMLGDVSYDLIQFHFHTPSEHTYFGDKFPMEVHMVHKTKDGNLAVVGVFMKSGEHNAEFEKLLKHAPEQANQTRVSQQTQIDVESFLPKDKRYYHYSGSLTTPPCSENVNWIVMNSPIEVSPDQVKRFTDIVGNNARPIQNKHWRNLLVTSKH